MTTVAVYKGCIAADSRASINGAYLDKSVKIKTLNCIKYKGVRITHIAAAGIASATIPMLMFLMKHDTPEHDLSELVISDLIGYSDNASLIGLLETGEGLEFKRVIRTNGLGTIKLTVKKPTSLITIGSGGKALSVVDSIVKARTAVETVFLAGLFDNNTGGPVWYATAKNTKLRYLETMPESTLTYVSEKLVNRAKQNFKGY